MYPYILFDNGNAKGVFGGFGFTKSFDDIFFPYSLYINLDGYEKHTTLEDYHNLFTYNNLNLLNDEKINFLNKYNIFEKAVFISWIKDDDFIIFYHFEWFHSRFITKDYHYLVKNVNYEFISSRKSFFWNDNINPLMDMSNFNYIYDYLSPYLNNQKIGLVKIDDSLYCMVYGYYYSTTNEYDIHKYFFKVQKKPSKCCLLDCFTN